MENSCPLNPDIQEILTNIRDKYDLLEIEEGDDPLDTFLTEDVDLEGIRQDLAEQIKHIDYLIPAQFKQLYQVYQSGDDLTITDIGQYPQEIQILILNLFESTQRMYEPAFRELDKMIEKFIKNDKILSPLVQIYTIIKIRNDESL